MYPAFFITANGGYQVRIDPRDSNIPGSTMDGGSGEMMNEQILTYGFVIKLNTSNANKISYCPLVS